MLEIKDLHASVNGKEILKGINLSIKKGEVHAIMGPNGSGKSTLSSVLVGNPAFEVTKGSVTFEGKDLLALNPEDRSHEGLFLSFQYPVEIPGVSMVNFMRAAVNEQRKYKGLPALTASYNPVMIIKMRPQWGGKRFSFCQRGRIGPFA